MMLRPIKALYVRIRTEGLAATIRGLASATLKPRCYHIYKLMGLKSIGDADFEIQSDLEALAAARSKTQGLSSEFYRDAAGRCKLCFFACLDGNPAGILWVLDAQYRSRIIDLKPGEVELAFVHVEECFRGRGLAKALIRASCRQLLETGTHAIYAVIETNNPASQAAFTACGFQKIDTLRRPALVGRPYRTAG